MPKGVAFLDRTERICRAANRRYLDALADIKDPATARRALDRMAVPARACKRRLRGERVIAGFRNRHIREALFGSTDDRLTARRHAARVTRLFNRLHAHGYIAKIPHTHRWRVTALGRAAMSAVIDVRDNAFPAAFTKAAA